MGVIQWTSKYEVDVRKIDRQHRKIVNILNQLYDMQESGKDNAAIQRIFNDLRKYITTHFKTEEEYLKELNCPGFGLQKDEHENFIDTICTYQKDYFKDKPLAIINLFNFVWDWFSNHILTVVKECIQGGAK
ncbi:MAG: hemerythrin family protein [Spirochaetales bacterium]|nr:hemerythrin family protein [Spirochaetales bacterium]